MATKSKHPITSLVNCLRECIYMKLKAYENVFKVINFPT